VGGGGGLGGGGGGGGGGWGIAERETCVDVYAATERDREMK